MSRGPALAVGAIIAAFLCAGASAAPKGKSGKAAAASKGPTLDSAVAELRREYLANQKDALNAPLRTACDYFAENPQDVPPSAVFNLLEKPAGNDARLAAYVKWQLLGALPATLDEDDVQRLIRVYEKAPLPAPRYASTRPEQQKLDKVLKRGRPQDDVELTAKLEEAAGRGAEADRPVAAYRDELYRRLPLGRDKVVAGLRDAHDRMGVAAATGDLMSAVVDDLRNWAASDDAPRAQVREVAELVGKLRFLESPPYYASATVRKNRLGWLVKTDRLLTKKRMADLHKLLLDAAGMPAPPDDATAADSGDRGGSGKGKTKKDAGKDKKKAGTDS